MAAASGGVHLPVVGWPEISSAPLEEPRRRAGGAKRTKLRPLDFAGRRPRQLGDVFDEPRIREAVMSAGFTRFRRAAQTPFNLVFEARP